MASEPAEPTTRQHDVIEAAVWIIDGQMGGYHATKGRQRDAVRALAEAGLLADPAQTTELERLRRHLSASDGAEREWHNLATNGVTAAAKWKSERDLLLWLHAEAAWRVVGFDALTAALARFLKEAQANRDALSLLLRGMARKLVNYRKWMSGDDVPVVHRLRREAEERQARIDAVLAIRDQPNNVAPRHDFSGGWKHAIDAVRAALVGDQPPAEEPKHKTEGGMCCNGKRGCGGPGSYCCSRTVYFHRHHDGSRGPFPVLGDAAGDLP